MLKNKFSSKKDMVLSQWFESAFSSDKFNPGKALRYTHKENSDLIKNTPHFNEIFLELARIEIEKKCRLLYVEDIYRLTQKARIMSRHKGRDFNSITNNISEEKIKDSDSEAYSTAALNPDLYSRLYKQLQNVRYTIDTFTSEDQGHFIRTLKLKNAQETIVKIIDEMVRESQSKKITPEMERTLRTEINRWTNFAETINKRLYRKITQLNFKDYVEKLEHSFKRINH